MAIVILSYINAQAKHQDIKIVSVNGAEVTLDQEASRARGLRCMVVKHSTGNKPFY